MTSCGSEIFRRCDLVHHLSGGVAQHAFRADVEYLNNASGVSGDTRKILTIENRTLQGSCLEQCIFRLLARSVVGAYQQIADDVILVVAQCGDRHHAGKRLPSLRI